MSTNSNRCDPSSKMNDRWRSESDILGKMCNLRTLSRAVTEKLQRTERKLSEMIESKGIEVRELLVH